jgi:hypothetical protein
MGAQVAGYGAAGAGAQAVQGAGTGRQQAAGSAETTAVSGTLRAVTVGLINDTYAEILSGLNAGEVVLYQTTTSTSSSNGNRTRVSVMPMMGF